MSNESFSWQKCWWFLPGVGHVKIMESDVLDDLFSLVNITL